MRHLLFLILFFLSHLNVFSQEYGIKLASHETSKDFRTGAALIIDNSIKICSTIDIAFEVKYDDISANTFGTIFRLLFEGGEFVDLNMAFEKVKSYTTSLSSSNKYAQKEKSSLNPPSQNWYQCKLTLNPETNEIQFYSEYYNNDPITIIPEPLFKNKNLKFFVGKHVFENSRVTDVPSVGLRNVIMTKSEQEIGKWLFNEYEGNVVLNYITNKTSVVENPIWISRPYSKWDFIYEEKFEGVVNTSFNKQENVVYITTSKEVISYKLDSQKASRIGGFDIISVDALKGVYEPINKTIFNYSIDKQLVTSFDTISNTWDKSLENDLFDNTYLHHTKVFSEIDSSLYAFGGYGQHEYKNSIYKYSFNAKTWDTIAIKKPVFTPRYLASSALSKNKDTIYVIGGYGSETGNQQINPKNFYDVLGFSIKDKTIHKIGEFSDSNEDICFANSFILDENGEDFYALTFPKYKFENKLQLVKGSLREKGLKPLGSAIPYLFNDIESYADLYYSEKLRKLYTITVYENEAINESSVKIYSIAFPPNEILVKGSQTTESKEVQDKSEWINRFLFILGVVFLIGLFVFIVKKRQTRKVVEVKEIENISNNQEYFVKENTENEEVIKIVDKNKISLFGNIQVHNNEGIDISNSFSPLLLEMFLLLLLHSFKSQKGLASKKLDEILWFDKPEKKAKNNRFVNLNKLKRLIGAVNGCELSNKGGFCRIDIDDSVAFCDYKYIKMAMDKNESNEKLSRQELNTILKIVARGNLINNLEFEWLDGFKGVIEDKLIDLFLGVAENHDLVTDATLLIKCSEAIFKIDSLNEEAMRLKCKVYLQTGKHSMVKKTYNKFAEDYKSLYGESYGISFDETVKDLH